MEMSKGEITTSYRQAKDKKKQIEVLSELNMCSKEEIVEILKEQGIPHRELPRNRGGNTVPEQKKAEPVKATPPIPAAAPREVVFHDIGKAKEDIPEPVAKLLKERVAMIESERQVIDSNIKRMEERQTALQNEAIVIRQFLGLPHLG